MSEGSVEQHIDAVDAYARTLSLRTRQNPDLYDITDAVHQLHVALRHLRVEAADADSLLSRPDNVFARQLRPLVDSCANTLGRLEDALDANDGREVDEEDDEDDAAMRRVLRRLRGEKNSLDGFLDAVQLQKSKGVAPPVAADPGDLDRIKDKVDEVAKRVFSRRDSGFEDDEDRVWKEFKAELEKEGFSSTVLKQHKDVLRAYIRSLETMSSPTGAPPSVRGMLEYEAGSNRTAHRASGKEVAHLDTKPPPIPPKEPLPELESPPPMLPPRRSPSPEDADDNESVVSTALILTKDIMDMDRVESGMANMHLQPNAQLQLPSSPDPKYITWQPANSFTESGELPTSKVPPASGQQKPWMGLAPDRYGKEIPMNAQWTRINRNLVSPEVLARAGVRYEARPTFVAILGRLSREQIADFARQSADCRAARAMRQNPPRGGGEGDPRFTHQRTDSKSSIEDDESDLFDESDSTDSDDDGTSEKGTKSYPFIVSPPDKTSPSATVKPKSILKNRNENHVRFTPEPYETSSRSPGSSSSYREDRRRRRRDDDREHRSSGNYRHYSNGEGGSGGERHRPRASYDDREHHHHHRRHRGDRDRDRERERERERKSNKKKAWGETLGAVGLGGAAVSLLTVLAEAAT